MKKPIVAVKDIKIGLFDPPIMVRHNGEAIREWDILLTKKDTKFGQNPSDFELYQIAEFDEETGNITTLSPHTHLASGVQ